LPRVCTAPGTGAAAAAWFAVARQNCPASHSVCFGSPSLHVSSVLPSAHAAPPNMLIASQALHCSCASSKIVQRHSPDGPDPTQQQPLTCSAPLSSRHRAVWPPCSHCGISPLGRQAGSATFLEPAVISYVR
jgi:hypothetical protein